MNNIFENAYFGKPYRTSEDDVALYLGEEIGDFKYRLAYPIISDITNKKSYIILQCDENGSSKCDIDIVSEWQEEINEEELARLADQNNPYEFYGYYETQDSDKNYTIFNEGFKLGYRKALNL